MSFKTSERQTFSLRQDREVSTGKLGFRYTIPESGLLIGATSNFAKVDLAQEQDWKAAS